MRTITDEIREYCEDTAIRINSEPFVDLKLMEVMFDEWKYKEMCLYKPKKPEKKKLSDYNVFIIFLFVICIIILISIQVLIILFPIVMAAGYANANWLLILLITFPLSIAVWLKIAKK